MTFETDSKGPRKATGKCRFCQHPLQIVECCGSFIESLLQAADRIRQGDTLTDGTKPPIQEVRYPVANEDKADNFVECRIRSRMTSTDTNGSRDLRASPGGATVYRVGAENY
jgi:hypothetical protein